MKVTILGTYDRLWGASIATMRMAEALQSVGADVKFLVLQAVTPKPYMDIIEKNAFDHRYSQWLLLREKAYLHFFDNPDTRNNKKYFNFSFSLATTGRSVIGRKSVRDADLIHLNWTNNAFLSLKTIKELTTLGKPLVWTLHDQWVFTGGCHYVKDCKNYKNECGNCPFMRHPKPDDLSHQQFLSKKRLYDTGKIHFAAPTNWMVDEARQSGLLQHQSLHHLALPIDTNIFQPMNQTEARQALGLPLDQKLVLFGSANLHDERKGFPYLYQALQRIRQERQDVSVVIYGFANGTPTLPDMSLHYLGMLKSDVELARCYSACDLLALPTQMDNSPLTVMEALSCARPVVSFDVGGLPDLVENDFNGYLVSHGDVAGLAESIRKVLANPIDYQRLSDNARQRSVERFDYEVIGKRYLAFYESLLK